MCNEFRFEDSLNDILEAFSQLQIPLTWTGGAPNLEPRASIRPTDPAFLIAGGPKVARLEQLRWGFPGPRGPIINFRTEGRTFRRDRCLVPVGGFYEFTGEKAPKSKWLFESVDGGFLGMAGLIREDRFTLLTLAPGPDVAAYHGRQPVIMPRRDWKAWLMDGVEAAFESSPAGTLKVTQVR